MWGCKEPETTLSFHCQHLQALRSSCYASYQSGNQSLFFFCLGLETTEKSLGQRLIPLVERDCRWPPKEILYMVRIERRLSRLIDHSHICECSRVLDYCANPLD